MMAKRYYDDGMINVDTSAMANFPQNVIIKTYPRPAGELTENLNDGLSGVDSQMSKDNSKRKSTQQPEKW